MYWNSTGSITRVDGAPFIINRRLYCASLFTQGINWEISLGEIPEWPLHLCSSLYRWKPASAGASNWEEGWDGVFSKYCRCSRKSHRHKQHPVPASRAPMSVSQATAFLSRQCNTSGQVHQEDSGVAWEGWEGWPGEGNTSTSPRNLRESVTAGRKLSTHFTRSWSWRRANPYTWFTFQKAQRVSAVRITSPSYSPPNQPGAFQESRGLWSFLPWIG